MNKQWSWLLVGLVTIAPVCLRAGMAAAHDPTNTFWPAPYAVEGWPAQHHDAHSSDWIPRQYRAFDPAGPWNNVAWYLRETNDPVVCVGGGSIACLGTNEYFVVTTGKVTFPNLWAYSMGDGSVYWHSAPPTNAVNPGPEACALTIAPTIDKYGNMFLADCHYVYCYRIEYMPDVHGNQQYLWRAPMPNLKAYDAGTGYWIPTNDPAAWSARGKPFMSFILSPEISNRYYFGGLTVGGEAFMFDAADGSLYARAYLETNGIGAVTGAPPCDPYAFAATNNPMDLTNNPIVFGIWATGSNTDNPDQDYFMDPCQLQGYLAAGTFGAKSLVANSPALCRDPANPTAARLYIPGGQSSEAAQFDADTNQADALMYRIDFDPRQAFSNRLVVMNYVYTNVPGVGLTPMFNGRMTNGVSSATSPDIAPNEKWVFAGDDNGNMYCFDTERGDIRWQRQVGEMLGSPTTVQAIDSNGWFQFVTYGDYDPWFFTVDAQGGQIVSNTLDGEMARHLPLAGYITGHCWRTEAAYQTNFTTLGGHPYIRRALGASVILGASNLYQMVYTVGWQRPPPPAIDLWLIPTHSQVVVVHPDRVWSYTNVAQTIQATYMDTNGTSEVGLIFSPAGRDRGVMFYGSQSCCMAQFLDVNNMMPAGMKPLYMRPYGGLGLFALPLRPAARAACVAPMFLLLDE